MLKSFPPPVTIVSPGGADPAACYVLRAVAFVSRRNPFFDFGACCCVSTFNVFACQCIPARINAHRRIGRTWLRRSQPSASYCFYTAAPRRTLRLFIKKRKFRLSVAAWRDVFATNNPLIHAMEMVDLNATGAPTPR
jgi:hypothetical protein